jgi:hypothetical protein
MLEEIHYIKFSGTRANAYSTNVIRTNVSSCQDTLAASPQLSPQSQSIPTNHHSHQTTRREVVIPQGEKASSTALRVAADATIYLNFSFDQGYYHQGYSSTPIVQPTVSPQETQTCLLVTTQSGVTNCLAPAHNRWKAFKVIFSSISGISLLT